MKSVLLCLRRGRSGCGSFDALALSGFLGSLDSRTQNTDVLLQCDEELGVQNFAFEGTFMSLREQFCYVCSPVAQRPIDWCFVAVICCMGYCTSTQHFAYFHVAKPRRKMKRRIRPEFVSWDSPLCQARGPHTLHDRDMLQSRVESCCPIRPCSAHWLLRRARPVQTHDHRRELPCKAANLFCCPCRARRGDTDALVSFPTCRARLGRPERGCRTPNQRTSEPAKQRTT